MLVQDTKKGKIRPLDDGGDTPGVPPRGTVARFAATPPYRRPAFVEKLVGQLMGRGLGRTAPARAADRAVLRALLLRALEHAERTGQRRAREVAVHVVQDELAAELWPGVPHPTARKRLYRVLARLVRAGLVAKRPHVATLRGPGGRILYDGTVIRVRLAPGRVERLYPEDLTHPWRDLAAAIAAGDTFAQRRAEVSRKPNEAENPKNTEPLKEISPGTNPIQDPLVNLDTSRPGDWLDALLAAAGDAPAAPRDPLADAVRALALGNSVPLHRRVDRVARRMARELRDPASVRYFAGLLWRALRTGRLYGLAQQLERLLAEVEEGGVKKPGALLASRMGRLAA